MQLQQHQASEPVRLGDAFLEDKQWDMEAMVLSTISGQIEDEEEGEEEELLDSDEECDEGGEEGDEDGLSRGEAAFGGWALGSRVKSAGCRDLSCEGGVCGGAHIHILSGCFARRLFRRLQASHIGNCTGAKGAAL